MRERSMSDGGIYPASTEQELSSALLAILPDIDRIRHVPGIALRRALFLHNDRAVRALRGQRQEGEPPMLDRELSIHDLVAAAQYECLPHRPEASEELLRKTGDVLFYAAVDADGDISPLKSHWSRVCESFAEADIARIRKNVVSRMKPRGLMSAVEWLQTQMQPETTSTSTPTATPSSPTAPVDSMAAKLTELAIEAPADTPGSSTATLPSESTELQCAAMAVLTNGLLVAHVGSFQDDPFITVKKFQHKMLGGKTTTDNGRPINGITVHCAIIHGDMDALRAMYTASRLLGEAASKPQLSFRQAMHVAACEGRMEMLQWLHAHSLKHPEEISCRSDTMAMGVRCGWADVVEWLHLNRPECAVSMSEHAVNDAAQWGHVDVLRVCHKYKLAPFTDQTIARAARAGQLDIVKLLISSLQPLALSKAAAVEVAIECAQINVVTYFQDSFPDDIGHGQLALSLRSSSLTETADEMTHMLWDKLSTSNDAARRAAVDEFVHVCANRSDDIFSLVLPFVTQQPTQATLLSGLSSAVSNHRTTTVKTLLPLCKVDALSMLPILQLALRSQHRDITQLLLDTDLCTPDQLGATFRLAMANPHEYELSLLVDFGLDTHCDDALVLVAKKGHVELVKRIFPRRTKETVIEALRVTQNVKVATFLLQKELSYFTERIVLEHAPACVQPKLMRFLLNHGHQADPDAVASFAAICRESNHAVKIPELHKIMRANDTEINALLAKHHGTLFAEDLVSELARDEDYTNLLTYIHRDLGLTELTAIALASAIKQGELAMVQTLLQLGPCGLTPQTIIRAMENNHQDIVQCLLDQHDDAIDEAFLCALREALQQARAIAASTTSNHRGHGPPGDDYAWAMSLLLQLVRQRPQLHGRLVEVAAEAGSREALTYLLGPRSAVDTSGMAMLPSMVAAARGGHNELIEMLVTHKQPSEEFTVAQLRGQLTRVSDAVALWTLLAVLAQRDPSVQAQLDEERKAASALFGFGPAATSTKSSSSAASKRAAASRAKRGGRR